eukprot:TRINITY_DN14397_c1_g1_i1.p1 TRINITY_DN14397_c1_g1~~TRINITY_DN14397_c1_g1_i1.p1  ORF type:complete len:184 (+),score=79.18 TRINITY_DN14397_c1_g1_i1:53-553(+)
MKSGRELFDTLQGIWRISRVVASAVETERFTAIGHAAFVKNQANAAQLDYSERVLMQNPALNISQVARKKYTYKLDPAANTLTKYFDDGRLFYSIGAPDSGRCGGDHLCINDMYKSDYAFASDDAFTIVYDVQGPAKNYEITTEYTRMQPSEVAAERVEVTDGGIA